ncbi:DNRLRE domain-containing protein [Streptomyces sp. ITFR-16]|uniref:DNRLRE domain-containing protein n=1 Tax=Streptomyces sp. ITFR-16 TaxID=3075198 RepID=UPI002889CEA3|nr:DNRLRE domain-containing protein [Streptomyces sp. ITFR-16]WNI24930.1 DNRLRE domain-containing protein [Streptomyces sp. ITFR-16]
MRRIAASLALTMSVAVLAEAGPATADAPQAASVSGKKQAKHYATSAADLASARVLARLSGKRVEALGERTETSTTWVNPSGSLTTELSAGPVRFHDGDHWRDVDLDLRAGGSAVLPVAHPRGLRLAGGHAGFKASSRDGRSGPATDLVTLGEGDRQIALRWKGDLPRPVLKGNRATYRGAVPGGDVVVEATRSGFEQFVNVNERPEHDGYSYTLPLKAKGLTVRQLKDGSLLFTDKKGTKRAVMPAPVMWDARVDPVSGEHTHRAPVNLSVVRHQGAIELVFTPDAKFLADPATQFPVTVDPSTSALSNVFDTYVQQGETVDWSSDVELDAGNPGTKNGDGSARTARSFVTWNTAPISDALVSSAKLSLWNFHSGNTDCKAYPWDVWDAGKASTASRWTSQPAWNEKFATSTETKGNPGCTTASDGWVNADVTTMVQTWASAKNATSGMGLRTPDESSTMQWKRFNSANATSNVPKLTVTYNYRPKVGTDQQAGAPFFQDAAGTWYVNSTTPTLSDTFADPNNDKVQGTFQVYDNATGTQVGGNIASAFVPAGKPATVTVPSGLLTNGKTYKFRTTSYDGTHYNLGWSPWALFTVDTSAPSAPTAVSSTDYPSASWVKGAGQAGVFKVTPPAGDQNGIEWSLDGTTWTKVATSGTTPVNITVKPAKAGTNTLQVRATDKADNKSEALTYTFHVGPGGVTSPDEGARTAARLPLTAEADGAKFDKVSFSWRRGEADTWTPIPVGDVTQAGAPLTAWPVTLSGGKSPKLTWNATSTVNPDGAVQIKADFTGPSSASGSSDPVNATIDRNADGAADEQVGPGSVNLLTGDYTLSDNDASYFGLSVDRTASSRSPQAGAGATQQAPVFGKEWLYGAAGEETSTPWSGLAKTSSTSVSINAASGDTQLTFTQNAARTGWNPEVGAEDYELTGAFGGTFTLRDSEGEVNTFTPVNGSSTLYDAATSYLEGMSNVTTTVSEAVTSGGIKTSRPKLIIAPTSAVAASTCAAAPSTKGCRVLEFVYASATTATTSALGDVKDQASSIKLWSTAPGASAATAQTVAAYAYDDSGRLREQWDPRISPAVKTAYTYDSSGRITSLTPPGQLPWSFTYGQAGSNPAAGAGMLLKASRATLTPGSASQTNGTATTSVVYGVPLTGSAAPEDLGSASLASWGQTDAPTDATAVFPADQVPTGNDGASLTAGAYTRAGIHYLDASGREVNEATPGHHVTVTEYDQFGNTVRALTAGNRELALGTTSGQKGQLTSLGIISLSSAERAQLLSTTTAFNDTGTRETEEDGPLHQVVLGSKLLSGTSTVAQAGSMVAARTQTCKEYDTGRPTDGTAAVTDQVTKETTGAQLRAWPTLTADPRVTATGYDWVKGVATTSTIDPGGLALTTTTAYDSQGRVVKTALPASTGTDAGATQTTYYSATGTGTCNGRPEWADMVCQTASVAAITGGGTNPTQLPTKTTEYATDGQAAKLTETAGASTRTTTNGFDAAGRPTTVTITGGLGAAIPASTTSYDPVTGLAVKVTSTSGGTITKTYDQLGRQMSYTDADNATTTTQYDSLDRALQVTDTVPSTTTYTYDTAIDPRGLETSVTDSVAGTFTARYDADGDVATQTLPGGYTQTDSQDPTGASSARTYTRTSDGTVLVTDSVGENVHGQTVTHGGTPGVTASQNYTYDNSGRLTQVQDTGADAVCTTRSYTFDKNSNRKSLATAAAGVGLDCTNAGATTAPYTYDSADRLVNSGYIYDNLGRTTALPGTALSYYTNDLVQQQTTGTQRQTWTLDSNLRYRGWTTETNNAGTWTNTATKTNHYDSDGDSPRWITENAAGSVSRNVDGPAGDLAATTTKTNGTVLQLANLHGDIALQLPVDTAVAPTVMDADEYGNPRPGQQPARYGWLGAKTRSSETPSGLTMMGVRMYNPATGRFLSVDPVPGGSANAYEYCNGDPVNHFDLDGKWWKPWRSHRIRRWSSNALGWGLAHGGSRYLGYRCSYRYGLRVCRGGWGLHARGGTTIGSTYFTSSNPRYISYNRIRHEKIHRQQWRHYGLGFAIRYARAGSNPCHNRYERRANLRWGGYRC